MGFMLGLAVYMAILVVSSGKLRTASRAMPMALCILCFVLIIVKAAFFFMKSDASDDAAKQPVFQYRSMVFLVWLMVMGYSAYYVGYMVTIIVGLLVILKFFSKATNVQTICITAGTSLFIYFLFVYMLSVRFPKGILF
jgi:hypothetical protein